jgi:pimeloyl-ACP methyl ester carboxylesterase
MARERTTAIAGRQMRWLEAGPAEGVPTLVWLHAFPLTAEMWQPQLDAAPEGWRVVAPDLAGFGGTADHDGQPHIDDFARDLDELVLYLGLRRFVLGGLSMGGYSVFAYLRLHAERVAGVILADTKSSGDTPQARDGRQKMLELVEAQGVAGVANEMLPKLLGATTQRDDQGIVLHVRNLIEANAAAGVARGIQRLRDRPDSTPDLARIGVPALVVVGEEDGITPVAEARAMASAIRESTLVVLPRAGHLANLERPEPFNTAVGKWLLEI